MKNILNVPKDCATHSQIEIHRHYQASLKVTSSKIISFSNK